MNDVSKVQDKSDGKEVEIVSFDIEGLPHSSFFSEVGGCILTFGVFDGLIPGQQNILKHVQKRARELNTVSVALIFRPRPVETRGTIPVPYLTAQDETIRLIKALGIDYVGTLNFTKEIAVMPADQFLAQLHQQLLPRELWLGPKAQIGQGALGEISSVKGIAEELGFQIQVFKEEITSTWKDTFYYAFDRKEVESAEQYLGRAYRLPAYLTQPFTVDHSLGAMKQFRAVTPDLLYIPPDGDYLVKIHAAGLDDLPPSPLFQSDYGMLSITTSRIPNARPRAVLTSHAHPGWLERFVYLEFVRAITFSLQQRWQAIVDYCGTWEAHEETSEDNEELLDPVDSNKAQDVISTFLKFGHKKTPKMYL
ncbi:hypothetical protein [Tengunoibacter tsumagoiensis]|uniref:FAD synthase n=1 Tax=Tengunoibacter tsumagoiensis TaxID=2014871 RepID=A0A402A6K2_9CHLR|nr:hypothetical protein [Tengunoibacter tsumagoiensis]GCE14656.1 hypothetical protein KTT_45150 [Tengunoibacter tsumagoiensis]